MNSTKNLPCNDKDQDTGQANADNGCLESGTTLRPLDRSSASQVVRRYMSEVWQNGDASQISKLVSPGYVGHLAHGDYYGPEGVQIDIDTYRTAFPDFTVHLDELLACGDHVVRRFTIHGTHLAPFLGHPRTGEPVILRGIAVDRVADGQLQESWILVEFVPRAPPA